MNLAELGPLRVSEPQLSRRIRFHQAWYRHAILGEMEFGSTPPPNSRPLGSILTARAAQDFRNLIGPAAIESYQQRRRQGWGVDPVRTLGYLTSSQALTINLFGALQADLAWCREVLNSAYVEQPPVESVYKVDIEYFSPRPSKALGDRTTVDVLISAETCDGPLAVSVETKLGDRFNSRVVPLGNAYGALQHLWNDQSVASRQEVSQLARAHALAEHVSMTSSRGMKGGGRVLLIHHPDDAPAIAIGRAYGGIAREAGSVGTTDIDKFLVMMSQSAPNVGSQILVQKLRRRYGVMNESEPVWQEYLSTLRPSRSRNSPVNP